jgi:NAD(P)-dependent dehydrogenase (short-subunit alcohol dehydrogenase family)
MVLLYPYELARRLERTDVAVNAVQPGFVATNFGRNDGNRFSSIAFRMVRPFQISAKKAAKTPVYLASSEEVKNAPGKCF